MQKTDKDFLPIVLSFFIIYIVWGSTYLANAWGLESIPPFTLAGIRFFLAGLIFLVYALFKGTLLISKKQFKNVLMAGFLFFSIGNGFVVWGLQYVDSGMTALLIALQPLNVAILMWFMKGERLASKAWIGLFVGMIGMALLVGQPEFINDINWIFGLIAILIGIISWAYISIYITEADMPKSLVTSAGWQMFLGSIMLFVIAIARGELSDFDPYEITDRALYSLVYLIIFGSLMAFSAFNYLLLKISPTKVATAAYINPIVALLLGWWLNAEKLSTRSLLATGFLLSAVILVNFSRKKRKSIAKK